MNYIIRAPVLSKLTKIKLKKNACTLVPNGG
jgi:hypothetical protein